MRRLQARLVTSSQGAQSLSVPAEGAAFNGWTRSDEGRRKCFLDHVWVCPSGPLEEARWLSSKIAAVERRKARVPVARHAGAFAKVPNSTLRRTALRLPHLRGGQTMKAPPRAEDVRGRSRMSVWLFDK